MTIHIALSGWQMAFLVAYAGSVALAFLLFMIQPFGGGPGPFGALLMAIFWPLVFFLAFMMIPWGMFQDWLGERKSKKRLEAEDKRHFCDH